MRTVAWFVAGLVGGYLLVLFGWIAYADFAGVRDRDGGKIMSVAFALAPLGGLVAGTLLAALLGRRRIARDGNR